MQKLDFKLDERISTTHRGKLREFCQTLGGDPVKLANELGLKVFEHDLPDDEDGYISFDPRLDSESGFVIFLNKERSPERKRFTVAHEIGHFVLHRNEPEFIENLKDWKPIVQSHGTGNVIKFPLGKRSPAYKSATEGILATVKLSPRVETEAHQFAANLLLPRYLVVKSPEFISGRPAALARRLGLSVSFVVRRFEELYFD